MCPLRCLFHPLYKMICLLISQHGVYNSRIMTSLQTVIKTAVKQTPNFAANFERCAMK